MLKRLSWHKRNVLRSTNLLSAPLFNPMLTTLSGFLHLHRDFLLTQTILTVVVVLQDFIKTITDNPPSRITTLVLGPLLPHLHLRNNVFSVNSVSNLITLLYIAGQGQTWIYLLVFLLMPLFIILPLSMTMCFPSWVLLPLSLILYGIMIREQLTTSTLIPQFSPRKTRIMVMIAFNSEMVQVWKSLMLVLLCFLLLIPVKLFLCITFTCSFHKQKSHKRFSVCLG